MAVVLPGATLFGFAFLLSALVFDRGLIFRLLEGQRRAPNGHGNRGTAP